MSGQCQAERSLVSSVIYLGVVCIRWGTPRYVSAPLALGNAQLCLSTSRYFVYRAQSLSSSSLQNLPYGTRLPIFDGRLTGWGLQYRMASPSHEKKLRNVCWCDFSGWYGPWELTSSLRYSYRKLVSCLGYWWWGKYIDGDERWCASCCEQLQLLSLLELGTHTLALTTNLNAFVYDRDRVRSMVSA